MSANTWTNIQLRAAGLPIGLHFVARYGDEETLYALAGQLEQARPWRDCRPALLK